MGRPERDFDAAALSTLTHYSWPGNVRELENAIERAVAVSGGKSEVVSVDSFPETVTGIAAGLEKSIQIPNEGIDLEAHIARMERQYLSEALRAAGGVRTHAAELLRMSYRSFRHYAKKHGV